MSAVVRIRGRAAAGSPGAPAALVARELAYNRDGLNLLDAANGGALWAGDDAGAPQVLVSAARQVETAGDQTIAGLKTFTSVVTAFAGLTVGDVMSGGYSMPLPVGTPGQVMVVPAAGSLLEWADASAALVYAAADEVRTGTEAAKPIAPDVAAAELFRTNALSGHQTVTTTADFHDDLGFGLAGAGITMNAPDALLQGTAPARMTIDFAVIDGGSF